MDDTSQDDAASRVRGVARQAAHEQGGQTELESNSDRPAVPKDKLDKPTRYESESPTMGEIEGED